MPLPFARSAAVVRPTFSRDFAGLKTLDHGTGPAITFTRASNATYFDANGTLQTAANDIPRFDHSGGSSLGLLIEESRTNSIRNAQAGGSTNGVIGSGGVLPTNWNTGGLNTNGLANEVVGTGTEDGIAYLDFKVSGTPTTSSQGFINYDASSAIAASSGQTWTNSAYVRLIGGSLTNVASVALTIVERNSSDTNLASSVQTFTPTSSSLKTQRQSLTRTLTEATTARLLGSVRIGYTSGAAIDLTLRIAAPQLEQGAFPTSYIPTTNAAATRSADSAVVTPISSFYNQAEGTLFAEATALTTNGVASGANEQSVMIFVTPAANQYLNIQRPTGTTNALFQVVNAGATQANFSQSGFTAGVNSKLAAAYKVDDFALSVNGAAPATDASGVVPPATTLRIGRFGEPTGFLNGYLRKIAYYPRRLSNALLQQLTT